MPRSVEVRIYRGIKDPPWCKQNVNATGHWQSLPLQKLVSAFRVLAYGEADDRSDENFPVSSSTFEIAEKKLVEYLVPEYGPVDVRPPNDDVLAIIMKRNPERGMPGCICSLDCSLWEWMNCTKCRAGIYLNRNYKRSGDRDGL